MRWTENQLLAINSKGSFTVVSAAAGSGKTAVLVERTIKLITGKDPIDIDKILIVTFTISAAEELKSRIAARISQEIKKDPFNKRLRHQEFLLNFSFIGTIDGFCNKIIKENFDLCGVCPNFRIADEYEMTVILDMAMNQILEKIYNHEIEKNKFNDILKSNNIELEDINIIDIIELFSDVKNDEKFIEIILKLYKFISTFNKYDDFLKISKNICEEILNINFDSKCSKILKEKINENMMIISSFLEIAVKNSENDENIKKKYFENLNNDFNIAKNLCLKFDEEQFKFLFSEKLSPVRNVDEEIKEKIKFARDEAKKIFLKIPKYLFDIKTAKNNVLMISKIIKNLFIVLEIFISEINKLKYERNVLDFSDIEILTSNILENKDLTKSQIANSLSNQFEEIMIDEYQDVNPLQDKIFNLISNNKKNLFIVGDSKQSIYSFRKASPKIFINYLLMCDKNPEFKKIILEENFRSKKEIIDEVNFTFETIMNVKTCEIDYTNGHKLISTRNDKIYDTLDFCINIIDINSNNIENNEELLDVIEAKFIISFIKKLIINKKNIEDKGILRNIKYSDFCILLRNANKKISAYIEEFNNQFIPINSQSTFNFFETEEIEILFSILQVINNPFNDLELVCTILSPVFGFNFDDLTKIRSIEINKPFYFNIKKLAFEFDEKLDKNDNINKKCYFFLKKIENYRNRCISYSSEKLIEYIIDDCSLEAIFSSMEDCDNKLYNIRKFVQMARKYGEEVNQGFSVFIDYVNKLKLKKINSYSLQEFGIEDSVKIMSIHKSKGLEFPICIIAGCCHEFLNETGDIIMNPDLGIGIKLKNKEGTIKFQNIIRKSCEVLTKKEKFAEEIRLLYVAMTRAKENLLFTITLKDAYKKIENIIKYYNLHKECEKELNINLKYILSNFYFENSSSFSDWILYLFIKKIDAINLDDFLEKISLEKYKNKIKIFNSTEFKDIDNQIKNNIILEKEEKKTINENNFENFKKNINDRLNFSYKNKTKNKTPLKTAASKIAHGKKSSQFIASSTAYFSLNQYFNTTDLGTAIHEFLKVSNFKDAKNDYDKNLEELYIKNFLKKKHYEILKNKLSKKYILNFLESDLGTRIINSQKVIKEYQFSILKKLEENSKPTFIQGAIDCVFKEHNDFIIVDYKSDNVNNIETLLDMYLSQLQIYKMAYEKCECVNVKELIIYSFKLENFISIEQKFLKI